MEAQRLETFKVWRSSILQKSFIFEYSEPASDSGADVVLPLDLSQYDNIRLDVRNTESEDGDLIFRLDMADEGGVLIGGDNNEVLILDFESPKMELFPSDGEYYYDIMLIAGESTPIIAYGKINVKLNKTQRP